MTWAEFKDAVKELMTVDAENISTGPFVDRFIRLGAIALAKAVPVFKPDNTAHFGYEDVAIDGQACTFSLPFPAVQVKEVVVVPKDTNYENLSAEELLNSPHICERQGPYNRVSWRNRYNMTCVDLSSGIAVDKIPLIYTISPDKQYIYLFPRITEEQIIVVTYEPLQPAFQDEAETLFPEEAVEVVYDYVKYRYNQDITRDASARDSFKADWKRGRRTLFSDYQTTHSTSE